MNELRLADLNMYSVTKRYAFVIEYCCLPQASESGAENCHGWVRYRSNKNKDQIQKPFKNISELPQMINEIIHLEDENTE